MSAYSINGNETLGIEFGSTRIKAVLIDSECNIVASGAHDWENRLENGIWTYSLDDIWSGLQSAYKSLNDDVKDKYGVCITRLASVGFSAMMHGYMPFDKDGNLLVPFRTWRNTITGQAAAELTELCGFNIPQRWSIAHLYQAILNKEEHIDNIAFFTTLAGYIHWKLSGKKVLGVGEASGMFPIDSNTNDYNSSMLDKFSRLDNVKCLNWDIRDILPKVLSAGDGAGTLTEEGARLLDPSGSLQAGAVMCPPEGDAGTGMVATNSITVRTGNVSAGTSIFSMVVLDKMLDNVYEEIDMVTTPTGKPVAMVHCNNCCTDLDYWVSLFIEFNKLSGNNLTKPQIYDMLYNVALDGDSDCGGLVSFNYFSGEPVSKMPTGRPMFLRREGSKFNLSNFMRTQIYSTIATLKIGMEILDKESVKIDRLTGHGGLFKTPVVGQRIMAGALNSPISVMETAGEGGAWGIAVLARYLVDKNDKSLDDYLNDTVFCKCKSTTIEPIQSDVDGYNEYIKLYKKALAVEKSACDNI